MLYTHRRRYDELLNTLYMESLSSDDITYISTHKFHKRGMSLESFSNDVITYVMS